jgi:alpha-tubulin suppressor-like RCC1 family protein
MVWNGGTEPTIVDVNATDDYHVFKLTTRDNGATWYGKEVFKNKWGGELYSWGGQWSPTGGYGKLGHSDETQYSSPTQIPGTGWAVNASTSGEDNKSFAGEYHNGALKTDGTLWIWGYNNQGQLGLNSTVNYSSPVQVPGTTWNVLAYGGYNCSGSAAIKTDGTLWTWGYNNNGQMGDSTKTTRSSPTQIPGTTWKSCFRAGSIMSATKTDGTLWAWGNNTYGVLGQNNRTEYNSPVQVGSDTTWNYVSGGSDNHIFAIKTNGTLWGCGGGGTSLGQNEGPGNDRSSPVQITTATNWVKVNATAGNNATLALRSDGTLYGWGKNFYGTLGQNSINSPDNNWLSSPVQIPGTTWNDISGYGDAAAATKSDGTAWGWGIGSYLDLSQAGVSPAHTQYSSPVQIPGAWSQVLGGQQLIFAWKQ